MTRQADIDYLSHRFRYVTPALRESIGPAVAFHLRDYAPRLERARLDEKLFRDPIFGFQRLRAYEVLIVDSPLFQRLRGIFQTAVAYLTYPSSIHTRFEHSLNCLHLSDEVLRELKSRGLTISEEAYAEVRLAALLHDIGHCIFSHGSEFFYREFAELTSAIADPEISTGSAQAGEVINYCILTCPEFSELLWNPVARLCEASFDYIRSISLKRVAQMIIGMAPDDNPERRFQTDIVNGSLDVDKLDYLTRDAYFTGISLTVDIDRLLPSLRTAHVADATRGREERRLVVDHRGIAVVEQLLFARMVLYDTVYHHHKVRAATSYLQTVLRKHHDRPVWPTRSKHLQSIADLLEIDEYEFYGGNHEDPSLRRDILRLRVRDLPERALVLTPRALADKDSHTKWHSWWTDFASPEDKPGQKKARQFFRALRDKVLAYATEAGADGITLEDVDIDIPEPPRYTRLGSETLVQIVPDYVVSLSELFPFQKVVNNYSTQYKYRSYVFAAERWKHEVAYAAFRAFADEGVRLNDLALILAHQENSPARDLLLQQRITIPDWRKDFYTPDATES